MKVVIGVKEAGFMSEIGKHKRLSTTILTGEEQETKPTVARLSYSAPLFTSFWAIITPKKDQLLTI